MTKRTARILTLAATALTAATAQGMAQGNQEEQKSYKGSFESSVSYTGDSRLSQGSLRLGDLNSVKTEARYTGTFRLNDDWKAFAGLDWGRLSLSKPGGAPLPSTLQSISLPVGLGYKINDSWSARVSVAPGIYSDFDDISSRDFNAPFSAALTYSVNKDLQIFGFVRVDTWSSDPFIGGVGARWKFAEQWTLLLAAPQSRLQYELSEKVDLYAGASFDGGTYRVANNFGQAKGMANLDGAKLTYRQINLIAGADWRLDKGLEFEISGGWALNRRFEYHDQRLTIRSSGAPYIQLGLNFSY